ncbi:MAG: MBL fold metallo-hydrolase [Rhodothermales bacterium]|nr:MBL fold metallo-hydrolase [Rhodothermales bacterium]
MLALVDAKSTILIDCGGDAMHRCLSCGIDPMSIQSVLLSHKDPDHVSGFPLFMVKLWLHGRKEPLPVYGIPSALDLVKKVYGAFDPGHWKGIHDVRWIETSLKPEAVVLENDQWLIQSSPGKHGVPVVGYRFSNKATGIRVCYSCDTEPCDSIVSLAQGCDILIHEANGNIPGHSSTVQAADVASRAGVNSLYLIHLSKDLTKDQVAAAKDIFPDTTVAKDGFILEL